MSTRLRKGLLLMVSAMLWLAGAFPDGLLTLLTRLAHAASEHPLRAFLVLVGFVIAVYTLRNDLLDLVGIRSPKRLGKSIQDWMHGTFGYSLIESKFEKDSFLLVVQTQSFAFRIEKDKVRPILVIGSAVNTMDEKLRTITEKASEENRAILTEMLMFELTRLSTLSDLTTHYEGRGIYVVIMRYFLPIDQSFNEYKLMEGVRLVMSARVLADLIVTRWCKRELQLTPRSDASNTDSAMPQNAPENA
jgi:hypothetical protein